MLEAKKRKAASQSKQVVLAKQNMKHQNSKSEQMVQKKLINKLGEIFLLLDGDKDGFISLKAINIEVLSKEAGKILIPIF